MWDSFFNLRLLVILIALAITACDPEPISIDPHPAGAVFSIIGQIDGSDFDMSNDVIQYTDSEIIGDTRTYKGQLHSDCVNLAAISCQRSFSITFIDSITGTYNNEGFPIMLEAGAKTVYTGPETAATTSSICLQPASNDTIRVNGNLLDTNTCIVPLSTNFTPVDLVSFQNPNNPLDQFFINTQLMVRLNGVDIEYYYFEFACSIADSTINLDLRLGGNTLLKLSDFDFLNSGGGINPSSTLSFPINSPIVLDLEMVNKISQERTLLSLFAFPLYSGFDSFTCTFPVLITENIGTIEEKSGIVQIDYTDENGSEYSTLGTDQASQSFIINSTDRYIADDDGNETVTSSITFNGHLMTAQGAVIQCENIEIKFGFGFLPY